MKLAPNPFYRRARQAVRQHPSWQKSWSGVVFRSVPLEFARPEKSDARGRETLGQALGRALFDTRVEGFLVPSARVPDAVNLVVFPRNLRRTSRQQVLEKSELKTWLK